MDNNKQTALQKGLFGPLQPSSKCAFLSALLSLLHHLIGGIFRKLLELMSAVEKTPGIAVLGTIIAHNLIMDSKPCKYLLQVVNDTGGSVLTQ